MIWEQAHYSYNPTGFTFRPHKEVDLVASWTGSPDLFLFWTVRFIDIPGHTDCAAAVPAKDLLQYIHAFHLTPALAICEHCPGATCAAHIDHAQYCLSGRSCSNEDNAATDQLDQRCGC
jgi:hypothetical protein